MATRFLGAGYEVYGEERTREHAQYLVDAGLRWCDTPREVAEAADTVFTSIPDDSVLEAVGSGPDGILEGLAPEKIWVDLSTVSPRASREMAGRVRARGAIMLDAPVSGSVPQVQSGTLTIMVGGDEEAFARVEPVLQVLGTPTRIGENLRDWRSSWPSTSVWPCRCLRSPKACSSPSATASTGSGQAT